MKMTIMMKMKIRHLTYCMVLIVLQFGCTDKRTIKKVYNKEGVLLEEIEYHNNQIDGTRITYDSNNFKIVSKWENGVQNGEVITYDENGNLLNKYFVKSGVIDGVFRIFYETGNIAEKLYYKDGKLRGRQYKYYNEKNKLASYEDCYFINNKKLCFSKTLFKKNQELVHQKLGVLVDEQQDSIFTKGEDAHFNFKVVGADYDFTKIIIGDFTKDFSIEGSVELDTIYRTDNLDFSLSINTSETGSFVNRFKIENEKVIERTDSLTKVLHKYCYVEIPYKIYEDTSSN